MLLKHLEIAIDVLLEDVQMEDQFNREVAVTEDEELEVFVLLMINQRLPLVALDVVEHLVYSPAKYQEPA